MIVAEAKPLAAIAAMLTRVKNKVLVVGCGGCVTVCLSGGQKEAETLAAALRLQTRLAGRPLAVAAVTLERQCDPEYVAALAEQLAGIDGVVSLGCGVGVQCLAETYPEVVVVPGQNTKFAGATVEPGVWEERCALCGECILDKTGGVCPVARCAKSLLNGPCGGSQNGRCEINPDLPCAWQLIYDRLKSQGRLDLLREITPPKDWSPNRDGGPRKVVSEDMRYE